MAPFAFFSQKSAKSRKGGFAKSCGSSLIGSGHLHEVVSFQLTLMFPASVILDGLFRPKFPLNNIKNLIDKLRIDLSVPFCYYHS